MAVSMVREMAVYFGICAIFLLAALNGVYTQNVQTDDNICNDVAQDLDTIVKNYITTVQWQYPEPHKEQVQGDVRGSVLQATGADIDNLESIKTFACKLIGVTSVDELTTIINIPPHYIQYYYPKVVEWIRRNGGLQNVETMLQVFKRFLSAAHIAGFPQWPVDMTPEETRAFISGMVDDFGDQFVHHFENIQLFTGEPSTNVVNIDSFVKAVSDATDPNDFANISGLSIGTVHGMQQILRVLRWGDYEENTHFELMDTIVSLMWKLDRQHFFDLQ